ncbi:hypothetical protein M433DRAFT_154162 [Acidomyces richmondensis BFW]|nr:MAG: hypothetical protein FE78DRAFT_90131 [Acidomyces sp. 'richmondensis']KYG45769.1 hypothetical protein M433DRAFT_154162 [Acidomyces richmondensis BFW]
MAEPDIDDEDLFADLYADQEDEQTKAETEPVAPSEPKTQQAPEPAQALVDHGNDFNSKPEQQEDYEHVEAAQSSTEVGAYGDDNSIRAADEDRPIYHKDDG